MGKNNLKYLLLVVAVGVLFIPSGLDAYQVAEEDDFTLDVGGAGQTSMRVHDGDYATQNRMDLDFVRLIAKGIHSDGTGYFIQLGSGNGNTGVLDARMTVEPFEDLSLQAGRFKTPYSLHYLESATALLFSRRAVLNSLVPNRSLGGQFVWQTLDTEDLTLNLQGGLFTANPNPSASPDGGIGVARARLELKDKYGFHAAFAEHFLGDNQTTVQSGDSQTQVRAFRNNRQIDLGFDVDTDKWTALVEGVYVADGPSDTNPLGIYANAGKKFPVGDLKLEPAVGYDYLDGGGTPLHRGTVALNTHLSSDHGIASVEYMFENRDDANRHAATLSLQTSF